MNKIFAPPLKIQGKKTKLVPHIIENLPKDGFDTWIEPFMGSGVVGFNVCPKNAIFADSNPHIIKFYNDLKNGVETVDTIKVYLEEWGKELSIRGDEYFKAMRREFNGGGWQTMSPLFLFLNRSCFNGLMRFNKKGELNTPFCKIPTRFSKSYVTKICNQIEEFLTRCDANNWKFICQDYIKTIDTARSSDFVYCDPPYAGLHSTYHDTWDVLMDGKLATHLANRSCKFMVSSWLKNSYRQNELISQNWPNLKQIEIEHRYIVGPKSENRNPVTEILITNY